MSTAPTLRFLHAAGAFLDVPLRDVGPLPKEAQAIAERATHIAFERLITQAIDRDVDFLLLTGDTFDAQLESLEADVLLRQGLQRLNEQQIPVFIVPGRRDPVAAWRELPALPANVTLIDSAFADPIEITDRGRVAAVLLPLALDHAGELQESNKKTNRAKAFLEGHTAKIGLLFPPARGRSVSAPQAAFAAIDYLAFGDLGDEYPLALTEGTAHRQHNLQGLSPHQRGPHGASLVEITGPNRVQRQLLPLAPVRWEQLSVSAQHARDRDALVEHMLAVVEQLPAVPGEQLRLIDWVLDPHDAARLRLTDDQVAQQVGQLLTQLTDQSGGLRYRHRVPAADWSAAQADAPPDHLGHDVADALKSRPAIDHAVLRRWLQDSHVADRIPEADWGPWLERVSTGRVSTEAQRLGWQWLSDVEGSATH